MVIMSRRMQSSMAGLMLLFVRSLADDVPRRAKRRGIPYTAVGCATAKCSRRDVREGVLAL